MTRINVGIDPRELPQRALLAEHREMKRIPNMLRSGRIHKREIDRFCLGTGHMQFFTTRLWYLRRRYLAVHQECLRRLYNVQDFESSFSWCLKARGQVDYQPTPADRKLLKLRLQERGHVLIRIRNRDKSL